MGKLRYIVGTTASGKTSLALSLASNESSLIISADSRQLYRGMDVVTGKDHPRDAVVYGVDILNPSELGSVSVWYDHVRPHIDQGLLDHKQIIIVGGTGLYVKALTDGIETMHIPINADLRVKLSKLDLGQLKLELRRLNPAKFNSLNHSDQNNPRRLIRAIEVAQYTQANPISTPVYPPTQPIIGLYYSDFLLQEKVIRDRVQTRLSTGAIEETIYLIKQGYSTLPSMTALGYQEISLYLKGEISMATLVELWTNSELSYVKRQLTYFRKQNVVWYDRGRMSIEEIYEHLSS